MSSLHGLHLWLFTWQNPPVIVLDPECDHLDLISSNTHLMHSEVRTDEIKLLNLAKGLTLKFNGC